MHDETGADGKRLHTVAEIAETFHVSHATIFRRTRRAGRPGPPEPAPAHFRPDILQVSRLIWSQVPDPARYVVIGHDGYDNPIMLDRKLSGTVVLVDREQHTGVHVINTSIARFAACLLAYRDHVDIYSIEPAPVTAVQGLADRLRVLDPEA
jgi:hypothetical protein